MKISQSFLSGVAICCLLIGCRTPEQQVQDEVKNLQFVPVVPLDGGLNVGQVYSYDDKPGSTHRNIASRPEMAFVLEIPPSFVSNNIPMAFTQKTVAKGTDFTVEVSGAERLGATGITHSASRVVVNPGKVVADVAPSADLVSLLVERRPDSSVRFIRDKYRPKFDVLGGDHKEATFVKSKPWLQNSVWIRVPVKVYYSTNFSIHLEGDAKQSFEGRGSYMLDQIKSLLGIGFKIAHTNSTAITLTNDTAARLAIGYDCKEYRVWTEKAKGVEMYQADRY